MTTERDYVLGTHDDEIERLGLQHRVWRPRALDAWRRAGFTAGQTIVDVGCGPGYATLDLAEIVGASGKIVAVDRSRRFLDALDRVSRARGLDSRIEAHELDLADSPLPARSADAAWARWILAFVREPRALLTRISKILRPGGVFVAHEYFDYSTWRLSPRSPELEELVSIVIESWRAEGGEPDIGLDLPRWLEELGFEVRSLKTIVDAVHPSSFVWRWPSAFVEVGLARLVSLGRLTAGRSREIQAAFVAREREPSTLMITPGVLEVIAAKK
jgi:SAM-dependent methyltransferase